MDQLTGRPNELGDAVTAYHAGAWFRWTDTKNKIYANLRLADKVWNSGGTALIDNPITELPTESDLNTKLAAMQATYDDNNKTYQINRRKKYPHIFEQLDKLWHDIDDGKLDKTGSFYAALKTVKDNYPKSS